MSLGDESCHQVIRAPDKRYPDIKRISFRSDPYGIKSSFHIGEEHLVTISYFGTGNLRMSHIYKRVPLVMPGSIASHPGCYRFLFTKSCRLLKIIFFTCKSEELCC